MAAAATAEQKTTVRMWAVETVLAKHAAFQGVTMPAATEVIAEARKLALFVLEDR